jgi:nucleoside-diphosphate-sugar epimerase
MGKILVTGGAGFIGSHLVHGLVKSGKDIRVLDNFSSGRKENLAGIRKDIHLVKGDIRDRRTVERAFDGVSHVFHLAAIASIHQSVADPITTWDVNVSGAINMFDAARRFGVSRLVFISSASVYGSDTPVPFRELMPLRGSSPYASSKLMGEQLCDLYWRLYGLPTVALRFFSVYGPRQNPYSQYANVIPAFSTRVSLKETPVIYGDGKQTRDFIYVGDVVRALLLTMKLNRVRGEVINFGSGRQTSINELLKSIQKILGTKVKPQYLPKKAGDDPHTLADTAKCRRLLKITRVADLETGLKKTCPWYSQEAARRKQ